MLYTRKTKHGVKIKTGFENKQAMNVLLVLNF